MINGRELTILRHPHEPETQWVPTAQKMAEGKYHMEGPCIPPSSSSARSKRSSTTSFIPIRPVKKTVILFDGAED